MTCGDYGGLNSHGDPCSRSVKAGFTRCNLHGGNGAAAKIKAEQAMALLRMPAIETLYRILEQSEKQTCPTCGFPAGDTDEKRMLVRACQTILDRTGMGPHATLEITAQSDGSPINLDMLSLEEREELLLCLAKVRAIKAAVRSRQLGALADAPAALPDVVVQAGGATTP